MPSFFTLLLMVGPLAAAIFVLVRKPAGLVSNVDLLDAWVVRRSMEAADAEDFFNRVVMRSLLWPFNTIGTFSSDIDDPYLKTALRVFAAGYLVAMFILLVDSLPYVFGALLVMILFLVALQNLLNGSGSTKPLYKGRDDIDASGPATVADATTVNRAMPRDQTPRA